MKRLLPLGFAAIALLAIACQTSNNGTARNISHAKSKRSQGVAKCQANKQGNFLR